MNKIKTEITVSTNPEDEITQEIPVVVKDVGIQATAATGGSVEAPAVERIDPDRPDTSDHDLARFYGAETDGGM